MVVVLAVVLVLLRYARGEGPCGLDHRLGDRRLVPVGAGVGDLKRHLWASAGEGGSRPAEGRDASQDECRDREGEESPGHALVTVRDEGTCRSPRVRNLPVTSS